MLVPLTLKYGLYANLATSRGKVKHSYGMPLFVSASRTWVLLHASGFRVIIPNFNVGRSLLSLRDMLNECALKVSVAKRKNGFYSLSLKPKILPGNALKKAFNASKCLLMLSPMNAPTIRQMIRLVRAKKGSPIEFAICI